MKEYEKIDFEEMYEASEEMYEKEYSHGEYCHEQSFKWGFQEGVAFIENRIKNYE